MNKYKVQCKDLKFGLRRPINTDPLHYANWSVARTMALILPPQSGKADQLGGSVKCVIAKQNLTLIHDSHLTHIQAEFQHELLNDAKTDIFQLMMGVI